jgi:hypothetical protein
MDSTNDAASEVRGPKSWVLAASFETNDLSASPTFASRLADLGPRTSDFVLSEHEKRISS